MISENTITPSVSIAVAVRPCCKGNICEQQISPLSTLCVAGRIRICKVQGDRKLCARMAAMGLYPGIEGELLCPDNGSQCILRVDGGRFCLDRSMSENILVSAN